MEMLKQWSQWQDPILSPFTLKKQNGHALIYIKVSSFEVLLDMLDDEINFENQGRVSHLTWSVSHCYS